MPTFNGPKYDNDRLARETKIPSWKSLTLNETSVDDDGIAMLASAVNLEEIHICSKRISDRSIKVICELPKIESILLDGVPNVTDCGISHVRNVQNLSELYLNGTQLTNAGMSALSALTSIWSLNLNGTNITDDGLKTIGNLKSLKRLSVRSTGITGLGLSYLPVMERGYIYLENALVSDAGLEIGLSHQPLLENLWVGGTDVSDKSMPKIAKLRELADLQLNDTKVTERGISLLVGHPSLGVLYLRGLPVKKSLVATLERQSDNDLLVYT